MSVVKVTYRIARTGQPVPTDAPAPPDYVPWPHAPITWTRIESDYGPGIVRPRDSITTRADEQGEGAVYLAPGRYRITLPSRDTRDVTVSAEPAEIDLSALLAGGGVEPDDPQYPTLLSQLREDLDAEMAEHMEEIEAAKEAAAQSADDAAQARDAAQGYAEDAQQAAQATAADRLAVSQDRQAIETEQAARLAAIEAAGDTQVGRVTAEGTAQVALIEGAGQGRLLPADAPDRSIAQRQGGAWVAIPYPEIVLVNQFAPITPGLAGWSVINATATASDGVVTVQPTAPAEVVSHHFGTNFNVDFESGHLWYFAADVFGGTSLTFRRSNQPRWRKTTSSGWERMSIIFADIVSRRVGWEDDDLNEFQVRHPVAIDLTATFGAGREPSVDEMEELISRLPDRHFDGTIRIPLVEWVDARTTALSRILQEGQ